MTQTTVSWSLYHSNRNKIGTGGVHFYKVVVGKTRFLSEGCGAVWAIGHKPPSVPWHVSHSNVAVMRESTKKAEVIVFCHLIIEVTACYHRCIWVVDKSSPYSVRRPHIRVCVSRGGNHTLATLQQHISDLRVLHLPVLLCRYSPNRDNISSLSSFLAPIT